MKDQKLPTPQIGEKIRIYNPDFPEIGSERHINRIDGKTYRVRVEEHNRKDGTYVASILGEVKK